VPSVQARPDNHQPPTQQTTHAGAKISNPPPKNSCSRRTFRVLTVTVTAVTISCSRDSRTVGRSHGVTTAAIISAAVGPAADAAMAVDSYISVAAARAAGPIATVATSTIANGAETQVFCESRRGALEK